MANKNNINLIIDSDTANDIDDCFAIAYAFANKDKLNIEAITIAPFVDKKRHITVRDSIIEGALEASRTLRYVGVKDNSIIYKGSESFFTNLHDKTSPAVEKIIATAKEKEITIACLGPLTNVAIALSKAPQIKNNISIVWLGLSHTFMEEFTDTNYRTDKKAFEFLIKSGVLMTIIPSYVGKFIVTSKNNFEKTVAVNDIGRYLLRKIKADEFNNDDLGLKTIYDLAPIVYIINPNWFKTKAISANRLLKEQSKISMGVLVNYVYDMLPNQVVWKDFVAKVTKFGNEITPNKTFFISDTHFSNMRDYNLEKTPFRNIKEYDAELVQRWNSVVSDADMVYHIGDFGNYEMIKHLKGQVILVCGNYEKADYGNDFASFRERLIALGFKDVVKDGMFLNEKFEGQDIYLTHKPRDCKKDCLNLFGHVHDLKPLKRNGFNVCTTYHHFTPVPLKLVKKHFAFIKHFADQDVFEN